MTQDEFSLEEYHGTARLFPLPNLVMFPHVAQPLHIFEPRYRQLMADALDDDRLMAIVLLRPGWEEDYHKRPPIHTTACLGRVLQEERLPDGRYNLLLHGVARIRIRDELKSEKLYRLAHADLVMDVEPETELEEQSLLDELARGVTPFFSGHASAMEQLERLLDSDLPLGALTDIFSFALPLEPEAKQLLLDEACSAKRVRLLLHSLKEKVPPGAGKPGRRRYPPTFSEN